MLGWETDFYPVRVLGGVVLSLSLSLSLSLYEGGKLQPSNGQKSCTHGSRNFIQYWGWGLEKGSCVILIYPVLYWINFSLRWELQGSKLGMANPGVSGRRGFLAVSFPLFHSSARTRGIVKTCGFTRSLCENWARAMRAKRGVAVHLQPYFGVFGFH